LAATEEGEGVVVEDVGDALALRVGFEVDVVATFLFFFSDAKDEWDCIVAIGFRDRGYLNTGARRGLPTVEDFPVAFMVVEVESGGS
jgi:hypothetical protein